MSTRTKSSRAFANTQNEINSYACVLFPEEKKYSVLSCSKIRHDRENKARKYTLHRGQEYDLVIICKGNKQACDKRARIFEKALETDANNDLSSLSSGDDESETNNFSDSFEESVKPVKIYKKNQTKKKIVNSSSINSITTEYLRTTTISVTPDNAYATNDHQFSIAQANQQHISSEHQPENS